MASRVVSRWALTLWLAASAANAQDADRSSARLTEMQLAKLQHEVAKLADERRQPAWVRSPWLSVLFAFTGGLVGAGLAAASATYNARRTRLGTFDLELLKRRLDAFRDFVAATEVLALYFPHEALGPAGCRDAGHKLRAGYFSGAGVLLSNETRDRYFLLMQALTRAATADALDAPALDDYPAWIGTGRVDRYRAALERLHGSSLDAQAADWRFGKLALASSAEERGRLATRLHSADEPAERRDEAAALLFQDFVLLQTLSSRLRTALTEDVRSRRRPDEPEPYGNRSSARW